MSRHTKYTCVFSLDELKALKIIVGFFRRSVPYRGILFQKACRLEPEIEIKIMKLEKREKQLEKKCPKK